MFMVLSCLADIWPAWANQHRASKLDLRPSAWWCPVQQAFDQRTPGQTNWACNFKVGTPARQSPVTLVNPSRLVSPLSQVKTSPGRRSHSQLGIPGAGIYRAVLVKCELKVGGTVGRSAPKPRQYVLWRHIGCWTCFAGGIVWSPNSALKSAFFSTFKSAFAQKSAQKSAI